MCAPQDQTTTANFAVMHYGATDLREEPAALARMVGSVRGIQGTPHPYHAERPVYASRKFVVVA